MFTRARSSSGLRAALIVAMCVGVAILVSLSAQITSDLGRLRAAPNENVGWVMAQLEVELLRLSNAVSVARLAPPESRSLAEARTKFDIFYSRVDTISHYATVNEGVSTPDAQPRIDALRKAAAELSLLFDGDDIELSAHLDSVAERLDAMAPTARRLALDSVARHAAAADENRAAFSMLLVKAAAAAAALIAALAGVLAILMIEHRKGVSRSREIERIGQRLQRTVEASLDAILVTDQAGLILDFNSAAEQTFGYTRNAALGASMTELIAPPAQRDAYAAAIRQFIETGLRGERIELQAMRASGEIFPIELSLGVGGATSGLLLIAFIRDISERVRAEQDLRCARDQALEAARAKSQFLAVMSHEMRTPLNGVLAVLDILSETRLDEKQLGFVRRATAAGESLQRHIDDVLEITHLESGSVSLNRAPFDLLELARDIIAMNAAAAQARGNLIKLVTDLTGLVIDEDRHRLGQVLGNLIGNAIKFTRNGVISVQIRRVTPDAGGKVLEIAVVDSGVGIAEVDRLRIFEDFVSIDARYDRTTRGYGLGLAICRRIAAAMGGEIGVESRLGSGSRFWIRAPLTECEAPVAKAAPKTRTSQENDAVAAGLKVLLVEDNETNLLVAREMLTNYGCEVEEARNGAEGVAAAEAKAFDLIFMDISMPVLDGLAATSRIRACAHGPSRATPIVGLTAHAMPEEQKLMREGGMQDCLVKPLRAKQLKSLLQRFAQSGATERKGETKMIANSSSGTGTLDLETLEEMADVLGAEVFGKRLDAFRQELRTLNGGLESLRSVGDIDGLAKFAHKLAGGAAIFGAQPLQAALAAIEAAARSGKPDSLPRLIEAANALGESSERELLAWKQSAFG